MNIEQNCESKRQIYQVEIYICKLDTLLYNTTTTTTKNARANKRKSNSITQQKNAISTQ